MPPEVTGHPVRIAVIDQLETGDGKSLDQLLEGIAVKRGVLHYHVTVLEDAGVLTSTNVGRDVVYALNGWTA